jgi:hypothetical protein
MVHAQQGVVGGQDLALLDAEGASGPSGSDPIALPNQSSKV